MTRTTTAPTLDDLDPIDGLILWCLRRRHEGHDARRAIRRNLHNALGGGGADSLLGAVDRFHATLETEARRPLRFNAVGEGAVSSDERALLAWLAEERAGDETTAVMRARWLVKADALAFCRRHACALADAIDPGRRTGGTTDGRRETAVPAKTPPAASRPKLVLV